MTTMTRSRRRWRIGGGGGLAACVVLFAVAVVMVMSANSNFVGAIPATAVVKDGVGGGDTQTAGEGEQAPVCSTESKAVLGKGGRHCECPSDHRICVGPRCSVARNSTGHVIKQGFHVTCKTCLCLASLRNAEGKEVEVYEPYQRELDTVHLVMVLADASRSLEAKFVKCLHSLVERASKPITLHLITDDPPKGNEHLPMSAIAGVDLRVYHGHDLLTKAMEKGGVLVRRLIPGIDAAVRAHRESDGGDFGIVGGMTVTEQYLALMPFYHLLLPDVDKAIVVDADVVFRVDVTLLWQIFRAFKTEELIGLVYEQQPTFRHTFAAYRKLNKRTHIGSPAASVGGVRAGLPGFNTGVALLNLAHMRASDLISELVYTDLVDHMTRKYMVSERLTPATLFTLMAAEHPFLFHVLPCKWNRQLCQKMRQSEHSAVFDEYHQCEHDDGSVLVYHESCNTQLPRE
ncbi:hypothetical protein PTSG_00013 [Salpingoeca rosetta]|uniref:Uncharacterized protein n=1 Tax=Salpingoeca rosetta (strain ATCC 50818 / BSB-021) TaxID=946362 RepID=F2TVA1_SALR5|nr:uncharacterized protein PTSG_00013 [Salpingoeca rosetta]EGD71997.1 hypothetical protein PTSG_00013 [Salpingoeca rosetta]|eukprot:XP_004998569.1 hypothetical protein PTSG_00013 [Salpingoeca rosetta]